MRLFYLLICGLFMGPVHSSGQNPAPTDRTKQILNESYLSSDYIDDTMDWIKSKSKIEADIVFQMPEYYNMRQGFYYKQHRYSLTNLILDFGNYSNMLRLSVYEDVNNNKKLSFSFDCRANLNNKNASKKTKDTCAELVKLHDQKDRLNKILNSIIESDIEYNKNDESFRFYMSNDHTAKARELENVQNEREVNEVFFPGADITSIIGTTTVVGKKEDNVIIPPKKLKTRMIIVPVYEGPKPFPPKGDMVLNTTCNEVEKKEGEVWSRRYEFQCIGGKVVLKSRFYKDQYVEPCNKEGKQDGDVWNRYANGVSKSASNRPDEYHYYDVATCVDGETVDVRSLLYKFKECKDLKKKVGDKWWAVFDTTTIYCKGYPDCGSEKVERNLETAYECNEFSHIVPSADRSMAGSGTLLRQILIDSQNFMQWMRLGIYPNGDCKKKNPEHNNMTVEDRDKVPKCLEITLPSNLINKKKETEGYFKIKSFTEVKQKSSEDDAVVTDLKGTFCKNGKSIKYICGEKPSDGDERWRVQPGGACYHLNTDEMCK